MADQVTARKDCPRGSVEAIVEQSVRVRSSNALCARYVYYYMKRIRKSFIIRVLS